MRKQRAHTHPCTRCKTEVHCPGTYERNYDGWPEAVCSYYHLHSGETEEVVCEACLEEGEAKTDYDRQTSLR